MSLVRRSVQHLLEGGWSAPFDPLLRRVLFKASALSPDRASSSSSLAAFPPGPLLLGHRGASARAPENTLGAFRAAIDDGAHGVELDTNLAGDSVPIVLHDDTLDRTTNLIGKPTDFDADELRATDAASWFRPGWRSPEYVPRLDEVLRAMPDRAVVNVELKGPTPAFVQLERRVVDVINAHRPRVHVIVSSFHPAQLLEVRRLDASLPIAVLLWPKSVLPLRAGLAVPLLGADAVHPPSSLVDVGFVRAAKDAGMRVHVWDVHTIDDARRLLDLGVDGLIVDDVRLMSSVVRPS